MIIAERVCYQPYIPWRLSSSLSSGYLDLQPHLRSFPGVLLFGISAYRFTLSWLENTTSQQSLNDGYKGTM